MLALSEPLRVVQLSATELDAHLLELLSRQLRNVFKLFSPYYFMKFEHEITALLKISIWHLSINIKNATLAQQLFFLQYINEGSSKETSVWMSKKQKILYLFFDAVFPWLMQKHKQLELGHHRTIFLNKISKMMKAYKPIEKVCQIVHFLVFLTKGKQQLLMERFIGIRPMHPVPQTVRQVSFELAEREQLWNGFSELLTFILSSVSHIRLKRFLKEKMLYPLHIKDHVTSQISESEILKTCTLCHTWPTNPHRAMCNHVFCYYCIASNFKADPSFSCPSCKIPIKHKDNIVPLPILLDVRSS